MRLYNYLKSSFYKRVHYEYRLFLWRVYRQVLKTITVKTRQGIFTLALDANDTIAMSLFCNYEFELDNVTRVFILLRQMNKCLPKGNGTVLDIGANNGVISIGLLHNGEMRRAIAIEPEPRNFSLMQQNIEQNNLKTRFVCLPFAVSDRKSEVAFELSENNKGDHRVRRELKVDGTREMYQESKRQVIHVASDKLDSLLENVSDEFRQDISIVWIDVQGHEGYVFLGAKQLLSRDIPVMSEFWPYGIRRAGMSQEEYCHICSELWSSFWVNRRGRLIRYPIGFLSLLFDEVGFDGESDDILFMR